MDWSVEYRFEDLPIKVNGIHTGMFAGIAELARCEASGFYVKAIVLDGEKVRMPLGNRKLVREDEPIHLTRPFTNGGPQDFSQYLFEAIETALYGSEAASEFFHAQFAEIAA